MLLSKKSGVALFALLASCGSENYSHSTTASVSAKTGRCDLICEGKLLQSVTGVSEHKCKNHAYAVFTILPRCPYSTEWIPM